LEAIGASFLILLPYIREWINPSNLTLYHHSLPVTNLIGGLLVDLLALSILVAGFLIAIQRLPLLAQRIIEAVFAGFVLWQAANIAIAMLVQHRYLMEFWARMWDNSVIAFLLLPGALAYFFPRVTQPAIRAIRLVLAAVAFSTFWAIPQLLHIALAHQRDMNDAFRHTSLPLHGPSNRRIIWILFDELSYNQTFDHPATGVSLPNFDRLQTESLSFSNLTPVGFYTDRIIPSLFIGRPIDRIRSTTDGVLSYYDDSQHRWLNYDPGATLFALGQMNGWTTGIDGWFNPYCRTLAPVLNACSWEPDISSIEVSEISEEKSPLTNAVTRLSAALPVDANRKAASVDTHVLEYRTVMERTRPLIENDQVRFVFLHLPVPHPFGIYDRQRHLLQSGGTYLDNLVLADDTLGTLLQQIDATPSAKQTTVIVSSDHSWRIPLWRHGAFWSDEEERASGGRFDDRPVLLIHFPNQHSGNKVNTVLPELLEHDIIAGMLRGQINNPSDLATFLAQPNH
jgi:hypothetical protein